MKIGTYISIITLNVNGLSAPTKRHRWLKGYKNKTYLYAVYKKPTSDLKTYRLKVREWKNIFLQMGRKIKLE